MLDILVLFPIQSLWSSPQGTEILHQTFLQMKPTKTHSQFTAACESGFVLFDGKVVVDLVVVVVLVSL
jgi:type III secretory pathway component EscR